MAMLLEATEWPIRYRLRNGHEVTLQPGVPTDLPDQAARQLLSKAPDKVRRVDRVPTIQLGELITWQRTDGTQCGPATVDFLHTDTDGSTWAFVTTSDGWAVVNMKYAGKDPRK